MNIIVDDIIATKHKKALEFIEEVTTDADKVQKRVLSEILSINSHVEYLQRYGLNGRTDHETYRNVIPTATYEDIKPYIERIANGDTSPILCGRPITNFIASSGTSGGERKVFPCIDDDLERLGILRQSLHYWYCLVMPVVNKYITGIGKGKAMIFMFSREISYTPGGLPVCSAMTRAYQSSQFKNRPYDPFEDYTSPVETILCTDFEQSTYARCLCGLYQSKLFVRVGSVFVTVLLRIILFLQKHWSLLCDDIRRGHINTQIIKEVSVREAVKKVLIECKREKSWKGIISRLWPNAKCRIQISHNRSMSQHIPSVEFYSNQFPFVSSRYACSESFLGINLNPLCKPNEISYTFIPNMKNNNQQEQHDAQELVELANIKLDMNMKFLSPLTLVRLYRYGVGDVLRVVGFKHTAPQFQFIRRKKILMSIDCEKTNELELHNPVQNVMKHLMSKFNISLVDYSSYADTTSISNHGHYVIYRELRHHDSSFFGRPYHRGTVVIVPRSVFEECCFKIEESLRFVYKENRTIDKSIDPLEIKIVNMGTFDKLMDCVVIQGTSISQYKTSRCMKNVELLNSCVVSNYFSQEFPH
ncbi:hypothetical protein MKX03_036859 [Papaver bracteatum]|nr:hypothetical protein MKX03_036859 [Papaver bracteatum]